MKIFAKFGNSLPWPMLVVAAKNWLVDVLKKQPDEQIPMIAVYDMQVLHKGQI